MPCLTYIEIRVKNNDDPLTKSGNSLISSYSPVKVACMYCSSKCQETAGPTAIQDRVWKG